MKKQKGFTLMELLAVIVILAFLFTITIPMVNHILIDSKKKAIENSMLGYIRAIELTSANNTLLKKKSLTGTYSTHSKAIYQGETKVLEVSFQGQVPEDYGTVTLRKGKVTKAELVFDGEYVVYDGKEVMIKPEEGTEKPIILFLENGNLQYRKTEEEGTIVNVISTHSTLKELEYVWSRSNKQVPSTFPNSFENGKRVTKSANSRAFYLWVKACDQKGNCSISVSNPFAGNLLRPSTVNTDQELDSVNQRTRLETCGKFDGNEIPIYNQILESRIELAKTKREKVAAAIRFLAVEFPYKIVYYLSEQNIAPTQGHFYEKGLFLNSSNGWGCSIERKKENTATSENLGFYKGSTYPNGLDCSGFVTWSLYNGGVNVGNRYSSSLHDPEKEIVIANAIESDLQVGDVLWKEGHVGIVFEKNEHHILVAEEAGRAGGTSGIRVTSYSDFDDFKQRNSFKTITSMEFFKR